MGGARVPPAPIVLHDRWHATRRAIVYAKHLQEIVREQLDRMIRGHAGTRTGFAVNPGKYGTYFERCMEPGLRNFG